MKSSKMESVRALNQHNHVKTPPARRSFCSSTINGFLFTPNFPIRPKRLPSLRLSVRSSSSPRPQGSSTEHTTLLVETFHEHRRLKSLLKRLSKAGSCPLRLLREDGDWSKEHFWAVVRFLRHASRFEEILQVLFLFFCTPSVCFMFSEILMLGLGCLMMYLVLNSAGNLTSIWMPRKRKLQLVIFSWRY